MSHTNVKFFFSPSEQAVEEDVKKRSGEGEGGSVKTLCMPFDQPPLPEGNFLYCRFRLLYRFLSLVAVAKIAIR